MMRMRRETIPVRVGRLTIGGGAPVVVQTMCDTPTEDVEATVAQIERIVAAGGQMVRLTVQGEAQVRALAEISRRVRGKIALVADVHFRADVAEMVVPYVDKVRINPGNYGEGAAFERLLELCRADGVALRIGVNHGSLARRIVEQWGDTPCGMVEAAMEFLDRARAVNFDQIVVSMKSSNVRVMVEAYRLLAHEMDARGMRYPLHLGVTEAGDGQSGRIKSAVGIGALLTEGLGDTIRVSLTEPPENELPVAEKLAKWSIKSATGRRITDEPATSPAGRWANRRGSNGQCLDNTIYLKYSGLGAEDVAIRAAVEASVPLLDGVAGDLRIEAEGVPKPVLDDIAADILQATRVKISKTEYVACPGCGRTLYDLQGTLREIKARTEHLVGLKIAVMGCIVNGVGEMADADYGYVGAGVGRVSIYRGRELVESNVPQEQAIGKLLEVIEREV